MNHTTITAETRRNGRRPGALRRMRTAVLLLLCAALTGIAGLAKAQVPAQPPRVPQQQRRRYSVDPFREFHAWQAAAAGH